MTGNPTPSPVSTMAARAAFQAALRTVLRHEGGYADHASDPGGATNRGITHRTLAAWRGTPVTKADVRALSLEETTRIYEARYWGPSGAALCAALGLSRLALLAFDWGVNGGTARARWYLQAAVNAARTGEDPPRPVIAVDGQLGPATRAALALVDPIDERAAAEAYQRLRWAHHQLRSGVDVDACRALLEAAGLRGRLLPTPNPAVRSPWLRVWRDRLRVNAVACGLTPFPPLS